MLGLKLLQQASTTIQSIQKFQGCIWSNFLHKVFLSPFLLQKHTCRGRYVIYHQVLMPPKFIHSLNTMLKLLSKFHNFRSSFDLLLTFLCFKQAYSKTGAKQSFYGSTSYLSCRSINQESNATEFVQFAFFCDLLWIFKVLSLNKCIKSKISLTEDLNIIILGVQGLTCKIYKTH